MKKLRNKIWVAKRSLLFAIYFLFAVHVNAQQVEVLSSTYRSTTIKHTIKVPDEIMQVIPEGSPDSLAIPVGALVYKNYYRDMVLKTTVQLVLEKGITANNIGPGYAYNFLKDSVYVSIEKNDTIDLVKYKMPVLQKMQSDTLVNGYTSDLYIYRNPYGIPYRIWFSKAVPEGVSVYFYFPGMGGVTKIEYLYNGRACVMDLVKFQKEKVGSFKAAAVDKKSISNKNVLFPFFNVH